MSNAFLKCAALNPSLRLNALNEGYQLLMLCAEPINPIEKYVIYRLSDLQRKPFPTLSHENRSYPEGIRSDLENLITFLTPELQSTRIIVFPIHPSQNILGSHSHYHEFELWGKKELIDDGYFKRLKL